MQIDKMDANMLLSIVNMKLRDHYESLEALCEDLDLDLNLIVNKLYSIGYSYSQKQNQFVSQL